MRARDLFFRFGAWWIQSRYRVVFAPLGMVWDFASRLRHFLYDVKIWKSNKVSVPVISVGNLAVGGTGKTPLVIRLAKAFEDHKLAIILRGYGKDEEKILQRHLPNVKIYADPNRVKTAQRAIGDGAELILLDDGFQYRRLAKDLEIVILRKNDLQNRCIPAGDLREGPHRLQKADIIVWDHDLQIKVQRILTLDHQEIASIKGEKVGLFCGIGTPQKFRKTLLELGAVILAEWIVADHEPVRMNSLKSFYETCKRLGVKYLVCTEKDAVKLENTSLPILFLEIGMEVIGFEKLIAKIEERLYNHCHDGR